MYQRFIVTGPDRKNCHGVYGVGDTIEKAVANYRKSGGKWTKNVEWQIDCFTSDLPFAPSNRNATENESDAYMNNEGLHWVRCTRRLNIQMKGKDYANISSIKPQQTA